MSSPPIDKRQKTASSPPPTLSLDLEDLDSETFELLKEPSTDPSPKTAPTKPLQATIPCEVCLAAIQLDLYLTHIESCSKPPVPSLKPGAFVAEKKEEEQTTVPCEFCEDSIAWEALILHQETCAKRGGDSSKGKKPGKDVEDNNNVERIRIAPAELDGSGGKRKK